MLITTKAIVISSLKYSEADLIVKCFTEAAGLKTYLLRNILKSKKGKLKASMFQPLTQLEIVANHKEKGALENMREAKVVNSYQSIHSNIYKSSMLLFLAEMLKNSILEEEENQDLYDFLEKSFNWLDENDHIANFHLIFLVKLTKYLGFYPETSKMDLNYFNLLEGIFEDHEANVYCISGENLEIFKQILASDFQNEKNLKLNKLKRNNFLNMLLIYYDLHLQNFRKPKSLVVLNEMFE